MLEVQLHHRPALAGARSGVFGPQPATVTLTALPEGHVVRVLAAPGAEHLADRLAVLGDGRPHAVRSSGPGQWLIVGDVPLAPGRLKAMEAGLESLAALVDESHGRVRIAIAGPPIEAVLAKGNGVDLALAAFPVGHGAVTMIGHANVHLTRIGDDRFEILVMRSFALDLWADLIGMALEFGISATAP